MLPFRFVVSQVYTTFCPRIRSPAEAEMQNQSPTAAD